MAISQRTATSGVLTSGGLVTITLPSGTTDGDLLVVGIAEGNVSGPAAPTGWTLFGPSSAGTGQSLSVYTALYSASLTLNFQNIAASGAWACNAFFEAGRTMALDGTPVAASSAVSNATMPTGAPTTGTDAGDYEVLVYGWTSNTLITGVASGSTIDVTRANSSSPSVSLGHNNTTSLAASTTVTAFSQTLSAANTRKTGVGVLLKSTPAGGPIPITVSASQATSVGLAGSGSLTRTATQSQTLRLGRATSLTRTVGQTQSATLSAFRGVLATVSTTQAQAVVVRKIVAVRRKINQSQSVALGGLAQRLLATSVATTAVLRKQARLTRAASQAQVATRSLNNVLPLVISTVQTQSVRLVKSVRLVRRLTGTNRIATSVRLAGISGRVVRATVTSRVTLRRQVILRRAVTQAQAPTFGGLPVQLRVVSTVLTRSLALVRDVRLLRPLVQATAAFLGRTSILERTIVQPTRATLSRGANIVLTVAQPTSARLEFLNVTPRYDVLVTAHVSQHVSLQIAAAGRTAREFVIVARDANFVVEQRSQDFAVRGRRARFTVEVR